MVKEEEENEVYKKFESSDGTPTQVVHYAWHGAPIECVSKILNAGFALPGRPRNGNRFGHGVYLSTKKYGSYSCHDNYSKPDTAGYSYLLLCEVLPGTCEPSQPMQFAPTPRSRSQSGVDRLPDPTMHIFWSNNMNTRVKPVYLIIIPPPVSKDLIEEANTCLQCSHIFYNSEL